MSTLLSSSSIATKSSAYSVRLLDDSREISTFLDKDKLFSVEAYVGLKPENFPLASWYGAFDRSQTLKAVYLMFLDLQPTALFALGEPSALKHLSESLCLPKQMYVQSSLEHADHLAEKYRLGSLGKTLLMSYRPSNLIGSKDQVCKLSLENYSQMRRLYSTAEDPRYFDFAHVGHGCFYGVKQEDRLIAMAGTHVLAPDHGLVLIGDVVTDPQFRRQGLASRCMHALLEDLQAQNLSIAVKVNSESLSAIELYKKIGFVHEQSFFEGPIHFRKESI